MGGVRVSVLGWRGRVLPSSGGHRLFPTPKQEKFLEISGLHFRTVPSNPHYFFYCPPSSRREVSGSLPSPPPALDLQPQRPARPAQILLTPGSLRRRPGPSCLFLWPRTRAPGTQ